MNRTLDVTELATLLKPKAPQAAKEKAKPHPPPPQIGPLRYFDKERRCIFSMYLAYDEEKKEWYWKKNTHGACGSPTHYEFQGVPVCLHHAAFKMNYMLNEMGITK